MALQQSRRTFLGELGAAGAAALAGCPGTEHSRGVTDVTVHNERDERRAVDLAVSRPDADGFVVQRRLDLAAHERVDLNNVVVMGSTYEVRVALPDEQYSERFTWADAREPLHVLLTDQVVFALQVG